MSPSKHFYGSIQPAESIPLLVAMFFEQEWRYHQKMLLWKIEARLMNSYEWKCYYRNERRKKRLA